MPYPSPADEDMHPDGCVTFVLVLLLAGYVVATVVGLLFGLISF